MQVLCIRPLKKKRDLTSGEILGQVYTVNQLLKEEDINKRVSHVVIMGIGEPFDNYDNVMSFIRLLTTPKLLQLGPVILPFQPVASSHKLRLLPMKEFKLNSRFLYMHQLMKLEVKSCQSTRFPVAEVIEAARYYESITNKRVTFEYILIDGVNDSLQGSCSVSEFSPRHACIRKFNSV